MKNTDRTMDKGLDKTMKRGAAALVETATNPLEQFTQFKTRSSDLVDEAKNLIGEATDLIPDRFKERISDTQKQVVDQLRQRPTTSTILVGAFAGIGAAYLTHRLLRVSDSAGERRSKGERK